MQSYEINKKDSFAPWGLTFCNPHGVGFWLNSLTVGVELFQPPRCAIQPESGTVKSEKVQPPQCAIQPESGTCGVPNPPGARFSPNPAPPGFRTPRARDSARIRHLRGSEPRAQPVSPDLVSNLSSLAPQHYPSIILLASLMLHLCYTHK